MRLQLNNKQSNNVNPFVKFYFIVRHNSKLNLWPKKQWIYSFFSTKCECENVRGKNELYFRSESLLNVCRRTKKYYPMKNGCRRDMTSFGQTLTTSTIGKNFATDFLCCRYFLPLCLWRRAMCVLHSNATRRLARFMFNYMWMLYFRVCTTHNLTEKEKKNSVDLTRVRQIAKCQWQMNKQNHNEYFMSKIKLAIGLRVIDTKIFQFLFLVFFCVRLVGWTCSRLTLNVASYGL